MQDFYLQWYFYISVKWSECFLYHWLTDLNMLLCCFFVLYCFLLGRDYEKTTANAEFFNNRGRQVTQLHSVAAYAHMVK